MSRTVGRSRSRTMRVIRGFKIASSVTKTLPAIYSHELRERKKTFLTKVSLALDRNCWVCEIWLLHSTVTELASSPFLFQACFEAVTVECSNHFGHTTQFLSNAKLTLFLTMCEQIRIGMAEYFKKESQLFDVFQCPKTNNSYSPSGQIAACG